MARSLGTALSGMNKPARKGSATMTVEPMPKTSFTDKTLASPKKPGAVVTPSIGALAKAGPGWKAKSAIGKPGDVTPPSGLVKT